MPAENPQRVIIVGGGFGGLRCALDLAQQRVAAKIVLMSDKPHFEYHAALYRVATGASEKLACVSISEILKGKKIEFVEEKIVEADVRSQRISGLSEKTYGFDYLVIAVGSETDYFAIPGLKEFSFGLKSIADALRLRSHIHEMFKKCAARSDDEEEDVCRLHFVIVGAGATGVEFAGELAHYAKTQARLHKVDPSFITIDLIEAAPRILPSFPPKVSERVAQRLRLLGVNIFCNRPLAQEETGQLKVRGLTFQTETVLWTAGVRANALYSQIAHLQTDKKGRVLVDDYLRPKGLNNVFVIGDGAATLYSGFAQTAILEGRLVAENIARLLAGRQPKRYLPKKPAYLLPVGPSWAAVVVGSFVLYGFPAWVVRRLADFRYFLSILPFATVLRIFFAKTQDICKTCGICNVSRANEIGS